MAINLKYRVASARTEPCTVDATLDGKTVTATVERLVLDLVSEDGAHGYRQPLPAVDTAGLAAQVATFRTSAEVVVTIDVGALTEAKRAGVSLPPVHVPTASLPPIEKDAKTIAP